LKFIDENADKKQPFFIYLAYNAVHTPLQAKKNDLDKFAQVGSEGRQTYDAMLSNMDYNIGRVMQELKNKGIDDNTLVIFLNDNGGATTNYSDNGQLRGMKGSVWEGGVRVGYIMRWNGKIPANA
ncbi:sulfatase-like hydrolase/transferase, partial [Ornithobacterium rhinotracheale]